MFLIYINDMPIGFIYYNIWIFYKPIMFADNTNLIFSSKYFNIL